MLRSSRERGVTTLRREDAEHHATDRKRSTTSTSTVTVVGIGYVGFPLALQSARSGYRVRGVDSNLEYVQSVSAGAAPIFLEMGDARYFRQHIQDIKITHRILGPSDVFIVCVPTPVLPDKMPDLEPVVSAAHQIAPHVRKGSLVIIESTVSPGVCDDIILPILERGSGLIAERDFLYAHCPERINPGDPVWNVATIPRVLGTAGKKSDAAAIAFYSSVIDAPIQLMHSVREAEAVKMVENSFRDINIAFVNELAMSFGKAGLDTVNIIKGASTKPFGFMPHFPGCGVGGHCIPVDPYYLIAYGEQNGFHHRFLALAREINNAMPHYTVGLLETELSRCGIALESARVALLGLSYKRDITDTRESPALEIEAILAHSGAEVASYDPFVAHRSSARTLEDALAGSDGVIIATNHSAFERLVPSDFLQHGVRVVVDGRNCLDKNAFVDSGVAYLGIGR